MFGLVKLNVNDDMVRMNLKKYLMLQVIFIVVDGNGGGEFFVGFYEKYVDKLLLFF